MDENVTLISLGLGLLFLVIVARCGVRDFTHHRRHTISFYIVIEICEEEPPEGLSSSGFTDKPYVELDGRELESSEIPLVDDGRIHTIRVRT